MPITLSDVRRIAALASLDVDETEAACLRRDLHAILEHFSHLLDVEPDAGPSPVASHGAVLRPDEVTEEPRAGAARIHVPRVIDR